MIDNFKNYTAPIKEITPYALQANAEGSVLLENDGTLPLRAGDRVAVFGRMQSHYNHCGTGSGGLVHISYKTNIYESLQENGKLELNRELRQTYLDWIENNPYDNGPAWPGPPWSQVEMPLTEELVKKAAEKSDKAVVIIARNAGESRDNYAGEGSYLLTETERENLRLIRESFNKVCVVLNVGNIIDMKWVREFNINAVLYVWQGGQDGGQAVSDILCGSLAPSGKLTDTIPFNIEDHPAQDGWDDPMEIEYKDDIFVGYRYFETFAPEKVMYPFGYGKGYAEFMVSSPRCTVDGDDIKVELRVRNISGFVGKETVQVYYGKNGSNRPLKSLVAFKKTDPLQSSEEQTLKITFPVSDMSRFDEETSCFVLEQGVYQIYVGTDVRNAALAYEYKNEADRVICECKNTLNPDREFMRIKNDNGTLAWEKVVPKENCAVRIPDEIEYTGDRGIKLADVYNGTATLDEFVAQLSDFDLACLSQGEGMNSPKVRPGSVGAFGGLTESLRSFGISAAAVTDGPSGIRLENGDKATSFPGGTMLACTFNPKLVETLYKFAAIELFKYRVDSLLGPGINVHRNPLCGRNFEYFSEDPYLTGVISRAVCRGLDREGITATVKHFAANNREHNRDRANSIVSQRALREIYLKPFEMVIRDGHTRMVMTAYNRLNGDFCSANPHLATTVLREDWGYDGLVMTDWWPHTRLDPGKEKDDSRTGQVYSQNDLFMVNKDARDPASKLVDAVEEGKLSRSVLQRNAKNILTVLMNTLNFRYFLEGDVMGELADYSDMKTVFTAENLANGEETTFELSEGANSGARITYTSPADSLAQMFVDLYVNGRKFGIFGLNGTLGKEKTDIVLGWLGAGKNTLKLSFDPTLVQVKKIEII